MKIIDENDLSVSPLDWHYAMHGRPAPPARRVPAFERYPGECREVPWNPNAGHQGTWVD